MANLGAILSGIGRLRNGTPQVSKDYPDLAAAITVTAAAGIWAFGAYSTIIAASVIPQSVLYGVLIQLRGGVSEDCRLEIATGGAGSEVVVARVRGNMFWDSQAGQVLAQCIFIPPVSIPANVRVSARLASSASSQASAVAILTTPSPL